MTDRLGATAAGTRRPRLAGHVAAAGATLDDTLAVPLLLAAAGSSVRFNQAWAVRSYHSVLRHLPPHDPRTPGVLHESAGLSLGHSDHIGVLALAEPLLACLDVPHRDDRGDRDDRGEREGRGDRDGLEWVTRACALSALHEHRSPYAEDAEARRPSIPCGARTGARRRGVGGARRTVRDRSERADDTPAGVGREGVQLQYRPRLRFRVGSVGRGSMAGGRRRRKRRRVRAGQAGHARGRPR
ncbi:hypothetical protein ACRJ4W_07790 [Streptomyces sp. GLT-R25]